MCLSKLSARHSPDSIIPCRTPVGVAVLCAVYGLPLPASAQTAPAAAPSTSDAGIGLAEITVTATRRAATIESVPYSLSAISGDDLTRLGVTDFASLANEVPGLAYHNFGERQAGAEVPIIRGLNASDVASFGRAFRTFEQSPVGMYMGNSPIDGVFQLDDIQRVEVLRGPQGTLYGAGALGGALRIIPNAPDLEHFAGSVQASTGYVQGASDPAYTISAMVNLPVNDTLALRASAKYSYEPGYNDVYGLLRRTGDRLTGLPVLADPSDPVNSPGVFYSIKDWNYTDSFTGRASVLWKPVSAFSAELSFTYGKTSGDGGPWVDPTYSGGPYIIDPRVSFPRGSDHTNFSAVDQPFWRRSTLTSADLSYDMGFATLSSTSSYSTNRGETYGDSSVWVGTTTIFNLGNYYAGNPINPRFIEPALFTDDAHTFSEELRLTSDSKPGQIFDYTIGLFYQSQTRVGGWFNPNPGSPERAIAQGCTGLYFAGATFPNCLLATGPNDEDFVQVDSQRFTDRSEFGELTYHMTSAAQITVGMRHFSQAFTDAQTFLDYTYSTVLPPMPSSQPASKNTYKVNISYEYLPGQYTYALWSQGFRRGGANSIPSVGIYKESPKLDSYKPDTVNNYEIGFKGRFDNGFSYSLALFDDHWAQAQISSTLPDGNLAVYNANSAISKGVEFELHGPLFMRGLTFSAGGAYTDAALTGNFSLPANIGGVITDGAITGTAGEQMPGSSKISAGVGLNYTASIVSSYDLAVSLNETYRSTVPLFLTPPKNQYQSQAFAMTNLNATVSHHGYHAGIYSTNLFDKRAVLSPFSGNPYTNGGGLIQDSIYMPPREVGIKIGYSF